MCVCVCGGGDGLVSKSWRRRPSVSLALGNLQVLSSPTCTTAVAEPSGSTQNPSLEKTMMAVWADSFNMQPTSLIIREAIR